MEQRPCYRLPIEIDVWLYQNDVLFAKAGLTNVSRDGMFIRTNVMLLPINSKLSVDIEITTLGETKRVSFPVTVVHRCLDGLGVSIDKTAYDNGPSIVSLLAQISTKSYLEYEASSAA